MRRNKMNLIQNFMILLLLVQITFCQYAENPYMNGYSNDYLAYFADQHHTYMDIASNPFLSHMISSRAIPGFAGPQYLPPVERQQLICSGSQYCVSANLCNGGYFTQGSPSRQDCDIDTEVCCTYRTPPPPPPTPQPTQTPSIPCQGNNYACVPPNLCQNGQIATKGFSKSSSSGNCYAPEVCCRIPEPESTKLTTDGYVVHVPDNPLPTPKRIPSPPPPTRSPGAPPTRPQTRPPPTVAPSYLPPVTPRRGEDQLSLPIHPTYSNQLSEPIIPSRCAAAMNCTEVQFCDATGMITKTPVILTKEQEAFRVPLTDCRDSATGIIGKCCRDPDYTDPWPTSMLGRYDPNIFGEAKYKRNPTNKPGNNGPGARPARSQGVNSNRLTRSQSADLPNRSITSTTKNSFQVQSSKPYKSQQCATRNFNSILKGPGPIDADFGEYPWQAMILLDSTKSLLCGGAIIADDVVATVGHCVRGRKSYDVAVKGGEWKLGSDVEPIKFQIIRVRKIELSPHNDFALLLLDTKFKFDDHIAPICIDDTPPNASDECMTTGWGKEALRVHLQDAIMHHSQVSIISTEQQSTIIYGQTTEDACELDPGSALGCKNSQGHYVLKGVYSKEEGCGSAVVGFTVPNIDWVHSIIGKGKITIKKSTNKNYQSQQQQQYSAPVPSYSQAAYNQQQTYYQPEQYQEYYNNNYYPDYANYYRQY